jgi:hypothetical protein
VSSSSTPARGRVASTSRHQSSSSIDVAGYSSATRLAKAFASSISGPLAPDLPARAGMRLLARSAPAAWPTDRLAQWPALVDRVLVFERCWGDQARAAGWSTLQLYGLHRRAPWSNLAGMGAAFLVAIGGHTVIGLSSKAIAIAAPTTGSRLRIYRRAPDADAVLAWAPGLTSDNGSTHPGRS